MTTGGFSLAIRRFEANFLNRFGGSLVPNLESSNLMKNLAILLTLSASLVAAAPSQARDRGHSHHHHGSSRSYHCAPAISYRSYRPAYSYSPYSYSSYPSYYGSPYGYSSYYSRPTLGLSFSTGPSYATYTRTVRSNSNYDEDLAVDVQRALARRGYYRGGIDGDIGPGTRAAIRHYQYDRRLEVTGRVDRTLLRSLDLS